MNVPIRPLLMTPAAAAGILSRTVAELRQWRAQGAGPPFHTLGPRIIRYNTFAIRAFGNTNR